jgi:hypothetical protein
MKAQKNIQQHQASRALTMSASSLWNDFVIGGSDTIIGFTYNNEPKQGGTEV